MNWIEKHPFKMALIVSMIASTYAVINYATKVSINDWYTFMLWTPSIFIIPFGAGILSYFSEIKKGGTKK